MVKVIVFEILFILITGLGFALFNNHLLPAQTAVTDSTADSAKVQMQLKVATIFKADCATAGCHRGSHPRKDMNLEPDKFLSSIVNVTSQENKNLKRVDTTNPEKSYLLMKIKGEKGIKGGRMPDEAPPLKKEEIKTIEDWIFSLKEPVLEKGKTSPAQDIKKSKK
ncbi:MAG: hypothetical protein WCE90_05105 [Candidatus Zixiibacteriota bacterium]